MNPQGASRRFAAAVFFSLASALPAAAVERELVGSMQGSQDALFPGSRQGSYGFVRAADGRVTYFRVNGQETRARSLDALGNIVGTFSDAAGRERPFVVRVPRGPAYVEVSLDADEDDFVG